MIFLSSFLYFINFRTIFAILCPSCNDIYFDTANISTSVNQSYCSLVDISASLCKSELFIDLIEPYSAVIKYITAPTNALLAGNGETDLITTMNIPLDIGYPYASIIYNCYDKDLCNNNSIVQDRYEQLTKLNYTKLEHELSEFLYNDENILKEDKIECFSEDKKIITCCTNWQCQATLILEQGRTDSLSTTCIPDRRPGARSGLIIQSKLLGKNYKKTSISYICNKNQCNNPSIVHQIRQILFEANLIDSKANNLNFISMSLFIICIIINLFLHM
ncbi:hypothetical protein I4U23_026536 [Adineta vaga]|nr:hypothetical protein I4U23_026536 [Adineta vaga]